MIVQTASVQAFFVSRSGLLCHLNSATATADQRAEAREWLQDFSDHMYDNEMRRAIPVATNSIAPDPGWGLKTVMSDGDTPLAIQGDRDSGYFVCLLPEEMGAQCGRQSVSGDWTFTSVGDDMWEVRYVARGGDGAHDEAHVQEVFQHLPSWAYQLADLAGEHEEAFRDWTDWRRSAPS